jgi:uroporphyrin-3 C-methyltransferase
VISPNAVQRDRPALEASAETTTSDAAPEPGWRSQARGMWRDMLTLVRIRNDLDVQRPLLAPEQEYFLRENLKLMLHSAQAALLQGSADVFKQNLRAAEQMLRDYYDTETQIVAGMQAELEKMRESKLVAELPDISRSLALLRGVVAAPEAAK